jgi:hypothetical protein
MKIMTNYCSSSSSFKGCPKKHMNLWLQMQYYLKKDIRHNNPGIDIFVPTGLVSGIFSTMIKTVYSGINMRLSLKY